ncbi:hypothetical protein FXO38_00060 [Capsicum annuum]|uniref:Uncharacterized protein n=1 Tax=Capsicum annuum TaxID=4072 RepID=A0A2G3A210_CAPAN|nr:hypothetical protein FXO38_00060 [Capsicum annuum]PHT88252.1 hypothetical protein T459_10358 [Capsicum annuum]
MGHRTIIQWRWPKSAHNRYRIHGYCEDAQEYCCREECDKGKQVMSSSRGLDNECSGFKLHAPAKVFQSFMPPKYCGKFLGGHSISREKEVQTGKTRYRPVEEILGLSLGTKWVKTTSSSRVVSTNHLNRFRLRNFVDRGEGVRHPSIPWFDHGRLAERIV